MTIQFGGLATGIDTVSIIEQLMNAERIPITRLESDKTWMNNRLTAFTQLDAKLNAFQASIANLGDTDTLLTRAVTQSSSDHLTATVSSEALTGTSYQVEVVSMAQVQKSISDNGFASKTNSGFGTGTLNLTVDGNNHPIEISPENNSLTGIMQAINEAGVGVSASIINTKVRNSDADSYRLILTGKDVGKEFSLNKAEGWIAGTTGYDLTFNDPPRQEARQAHIVVDGTDIYNDSNILEEAIPGVTLDLLQAEIGKTTTLTVNLDKNRIKSTIQAFAKGYNEVISFITGQSKIDGKGGGVLGGDSGIGTIKRRLQNMLTEPMANSGVYTTLSQLGFETQKDGTLTVDDTVLTKAIDTNLGSVVSLLAGEGEQTGLAKKFQDYLSSMTNSSSGMLKGRKDSITTNIKRIDNRIESMEARLEQRQKTMEAQFSAMESLVSGLNAQSSYLSQQMDAISNIMNYRSK